MKPWISWSLLPGYVSPKQQSSSKLSYQACIQVWTRPQHSTWQSTTWCSCEMRCDSRILQLFPNYTRFVSLSVLQRFFQGWGTPSIRPRLREGLTLSTGKIAVQWTSVNKAGLTIHWNSDLSGGSRYPPFERPSLEGSPNEQESMKSKKVSLHWRRYS